MILCVAVLWQSSQRTVVKQKLGLMRMNLPCYLTRLPVVLIANPEEIRTETLYKRVYIIGLVYGFNQLETYNS